MKPVVLSLNFWEDILMFLCVHCMKRIWYMNFRIIVSIMMKIIGVAFHVNSGMYRRLIWEFLWLWASNKCQHFKIHPRESVTEPREVWLSLFDDKAARFTCKSKKPVHLLAINGRLGNFQYNFHGLPFFLTFSQDESECFLLLLREGWQWDSFFYISDIMQIYLPLHSALLVVTVRKLHC